MSGAIPEHTTRRMLVDDLSEVLYNERRSYSHPWTEGIFKDSIDSGYECWLLLTEQKNIGHAILSFAAGESHLLNICINPEQQGKGLGKKLVEHMLVKASERGAHAVFLEVRASNLAAYSLYISLGFSDIGVRHNYYPAFSGREDALVLTKVLTKEPD
jgi:ribosomal-protein-alanine N-acetyltransferase